MDTLQKLVIDYNDTMSNSIYDYAVLNSKLPRDEFKSVMTKHLLSWKSKLIDMSNSKFVDPIMRQVAAINLYDIDSRLRVTS
nr:MAG TPA: hypothetical protein [Caudoviricetes sp.]